MANTMTVKLTATHASNTASNPGNAQNDDGAIAGLAAPGSPTLYRSTGDGGGGFPAGTITITKVEVVVEITAATGLGYTLKLTSLFGGAACATTASSSAAAPFVLRADVTADRAWIAADFSSASLEAKVLLTGVAVTGSVDYLWYEIEYTAVYDVVNSDVENIVETNYTVWTPYFISISDVESLVETAYSIVGVPVIVSDVVEATDYPYRSGVVITSGVQVSDVSSIVEVVVADSKVIVIISDVESIVETVYTIVGVIVVSDDVVEAYETIDEITGLSIVVDDIQSIVEVARAVVDTHHAPSESTGIPESVRTADVAMPVDRDFLTSHGLSGRTRLQVKQVPQSMASYITAKTITGIDKEFRLVNGALKALFDRIRDR